MKIVLDDETTFRHPYYIIYGRYDEAHSYADNYIYNRAEAIVYANKCARENTHPNVKQYEVHGTEGIIYIAEIKEQNGKSGNNTIRT